MSIADPNKTILTGENPFVRLSSKDGEPNSTDASYWRIIFSPAGPGHVLYLKSELTKGRWRIYSDNIAMARWLQSTVQGMLNAELSDTTIPCADAQFSKAGDPRYFWTEHIRSHGEDISLTWFDIGEPLLIHSQPNQRTRKRSLIVIPGAITRNPREKLLLLGERTAFTVCHAISIAITVVLPAPCHFHCKTEQFGVGLLVGAKDVFPDMGIMLLVLPPPSAR